MLTIKGFNPEILRCKVCGKVIDSMSFISIEKYGCVCSKCYSDVSTRHNEPNTKFKYKERKDNRTFSFEFETKRILPEIAVLYKHDFIPTPDGSINGLEWKSPIYRNLSGATSILKVLDDFAGELDNQCGTHIHIGTVTNELKDICRTFEKNFFQETFEVYKENDIKKLFGRKCNDYCENRFRGDRYQAINYRTGEKPTIEFRTPKFINSKQFLLCIKYGVEYVNTLEKDIMRNKEDYEWGGKCGREKAKKLSQKLADTTTRYINLAKQI